MGDAKERERSLPPALLMVLWMPVLAVSAAVAMQLAQWLGHPFPLLLIPIALVAAYACAIRTTRVHP
jgi:hypothetical protein